ncbi:hypothetical protein RJT34_25832 [Clitoria ternatea]|uniref:Uncharacterized protein n=1 Tax=Clitoria ternatea TaxID=43366 RepID=A0AAN9IKA6_CLITE
MELKHGRAERPQAQPSMSFIIIVFILGFVSIGTVAARRDLGFLALRNLTSRFLNTCSDSLPLPCDLAI